MEKELTGYPSIDKPWLQYYKQEHIDAPLPYMTAYAYLKKRNANRLNLQAIDSPVGNYTYGELFAAIDATAAALWSMGIQKGKKVLSMFPVLPHESFLFYGIDVVGAALCQIAPQYTAVEVCDFAKRIDADLFFVFDSILTPEMEQMVYQSTNVRNIIVVNFAPVQNRDPRTMSWDAFLAMGAGVILPEVHRDPTDLLFLASTGGSTGEPKSVMLNDNCFNIAIHQYTNSDVNYHAGDRWMRLWPIFSASAAVVNHHLPFCMGMRMLLRQFPINMSDFGEMILKDKPNHLVLIPQLLDALDTSEQIKGADLSFVKTAGCGGLALTEQFENRLNLFYKEHGIDTFIGYGWGSTESAACAVNRTNMETTIIGTAGAPMVSNIVSTFDVESGKELHYGEEGELCIHSPNLMMGYYNDPELTAKVLRKHADGSVWLHTGDLGTVSADGIVTVKGRMTRMILISPHAKIYPAALENAISKIPGVQEVAFCAVPNKNNDGFYTPICYIVPQSGFDAEKVSKAVDEFCTAKYAEDTRPKHIFIRGSFPLTKVGKPDIRALEREAIQLLG